MQIWSLHSTLANWSRWRPPRVFCFGFEHREVVFPLSCTSCTDPAPKTMVLHPNTKQQFLQVLMKVTILGGYGSTWSPALGAPLRGHIFAWMGTSNLTSYFDTQSIHLRNSHSKNVGYCGYGWCRCLLNSQV